MSTGVGPYLLNRKPVEEGKRHAAHHVSERPALNEHVSEHESDPSTGTRTKTRQSFTDGEDERRKKPFRKNSLHRSSNHRVVNWRIYESERSINRLQSIFTSDYLA
ncbi:hypothetical protein YC2023_112370 [Brassica napus]